ncbi:tetratricopeptide repeat protein [Nitzschia inconspicua]|uniref:Tetratricopeptide repeat protein n=1 Tax=Nitzschia inconspicua TaxID=303405 RepID=A0A9K3PI88_9STRA|nr:tetratricopeptide repeat protein [Nitzschia inconspicua]
MEDGSVQKSPNDTAADDADDDGDSECDLAFATLDLTGVDFDATATADVAVDNIIDNDALAEEDALVLEIEKWTLTTGDMVSTLQDLQTKATALLETEKSSNSRLPHLLELASLLSRGRYMDILKNSSSQYFFASIDTETTTSGNIWDRTQNRISKLGTRTELVEAEILAIAAFNLYLQLNYTGPTFDDIDTELKGINPHPCFAELLQVNEQDEQDKRQTITAQRDTKYHNAVLSELAVEGLWPCQVAEAPYFLLLARCILSNLVPGQNGSTTPAMSSDLFSTTLWHARVALAHGRLLLSYEPSAKLWEEVQSSFETILIRIKQSQDDGTLNSLVDENLDELHSRVLLEYGLAAYHFEHTKKGKALFVQSMESSGMNVEVTGSEGKRTKFQHKATAQMIVKASSKQTSVPSSNIENVSSADNTATSVVKSQEIKHSEDSILLDNIKYEKDEDNEILQLTILDQAILLALCLDVKNTNPADGLTGEEMSAYLARVLHHHDDWMVYSTALLERAWLEFEGNHTKERAILQMQALADQHTNRLTITQSTRQSIEESSPVEDRLKNLHSIVFPPRWHMLRDIAERYASLGMVTSAAELFTQIEYWDEVVDCYKRAGKVSKAKEIVEERLKTTETPRMWMALGDLTENPDHYRRAIELSNGRFSQAYISLGKYHFDKGELVEALSAYKKALELRPLIPSVWFRVGTISMQMGDWDTALTAFSEVVQQQPDEGEAWANVAAVHMHNKHPHEAYPALVESLKHNRSNWRVWISKLYTCLDLEKYDEAVQACSMIMDLGETHSAKGVPDLEEKCVRAIVGGTVQKYKTARDEGDKAGMDVWRRSLVRVHALLQRINTKTTEPWVFETTAFFHEQVGQDQEVLENLLKEYRALSSIRAWEKDEEQVRKVCHVVSQIAAYQRGSREELIKTKFMASNVLKKIQQAQPTAVSTLNEVGRMEDLLKEITTEIESSSPVIT